MASKRKKTRKKINLSPVVTAQKYVRRSFEPVYALSEARFSLAANDLEAFGAWLGEFDHRALGARLFFPRDLRSFHSAYLKKLSSELLPNWHAGLFLGFSKKIKEFLVEKEEIEKQVLNRNASGAIGLLDDFESRFGLSYWSISLKIGLLAISEGLEAQKQYTQSILEKRGKNLSGFIVYNISIRAEEKVTPPRYYQMIDQLFEVNDLSDELSSYLSYRLKDVISFEFDEGDLFSYVSTNPLIDQYEFFVKYLVASTIEGRSVDAWIDCCEKVFNATGDERLLKVLAVNKDFEFLESIPSQSTSVRDLILAGELQNQIYITKNQEEEFALQSIFPQLDKRNVWPKGMASRLNLPNDEGDENAVNFFKIGMTLDGLDAGQWLGSVASLFITPKESEKRNFHFSRFFWGRGLSLFGLYSKNPSFNQCLFERLVKRMPNSVSIRWHKFWSDGNECISVIDEIYQRLTSENRLLVDVESLTRSHQFNQALNLIEAAKSTEASGDQLAIIKMVVDIHLQSGDIKSGLISIVDKYFDYPEMVRKLPFLQVYEYLNKGCRKKLKCQIELSIFFDIVTEIFGEDAASLRAYAYEDFLLSNGITRPSEWNPTLAKDGRKEVYFFRNICVEEVMQFSIYFSGSKQLQEERVKICNLLIELDPDNSELYEDELRALVRNSHIQSAVKQLQQSKISIDENEIKRWAEEAFIQDFGRLQELIKSGQRIAGYDFRQSLLEALRSNSLDKSLFEIPESEAGQLLQDMVTQIIREAYLNQENGLDCYLSMRIRHGTLSGQLRNPVEEERLITKKTVEGDAYQLNEYWEDRLIGRLDDVQIRRIMDSLENFSRRFDDKVSYITEELIQIRRNEKENGLFVPIISNVYILDLAHDIENGISFREFVERCFVIFWYTVDNDLRNVQNYFSQDVKPEFHEIFTELESNISSFAEDDFVSNLRDASRLCFTKLTSALDRVSEWFELPKPVTEIIFEIDELIEIGLESVKALHSDFNPNIHKNIKGIPPLKSALNVFSDIFFIIFENIYRHSGRIDSDQVYIDANIQDGVISVKVENELEMSDSRLASVAKKLEEIRERLYGGGYSNQLSTEGGTGFFKLRKLCDPDSTIDHPVEFGIRENNFFVVVKCPISIIATEKV